MQERQPPPDRGARLDWADLPRRVRSEVERWLGSEIVSAVTQPTGFSPGVAARLTTDDGRRVFAKAVGPEPNADAPAFHRREISIAASLPDSTPSPRLLWLRRGTLAQPSFPRRETFTQPSFPRSRPSHNRHSREERPSHNRHSREGGNPGVGSPARKSTHRHHGRVPQRELDEGDGGWVLLLFEDVDGRHPAQPWRPDELDRVVAAMEELAETLTPSPLPTSVVGMAGERFLGLRSWRRLRDERPSRLDRVDDWSLRHLDTLVAIEDSVADALAGDTLLNYDVRADNILLTQGAHLVRRLAARLRRPAVAGRGRVRPQRDDAGRAAPGEGRLQAFRIPGRRPGRRHVSGGGAGRLLHSPGRAASAARPAHVARVPGRPGRHRARVDRSTHGPGLTGLPDGRRRRAGASAMMRTTAGPARRLA